MNPPKHWTSLITIAYCMRPGATIKANEPSCDARFLKHAQGQKQIDAVAACHAYIRVLAYTAIFGFTRAITVYWLH